MTRPELCTGRVEAPGPYKLAQSTAHSRGRAGAPLLPGSLSCLILPPGQLGDPTTRINSVRSFQKDPRKMVQSPEQSPATASSSSRPHTTLRRALTSRSPKAVPKSVRLLQWHHSQAWLSRRSRDRGTLPPGAGVGRPHPNIPLQKAPSGAGVPCICNNGPSGENLSQRGRTREAQSWKS